MLVCFETFFEASSNAFLAGVLHAIVRAVVGLVVNGACIGRAGVRSGGKNRTELVE